MSRLMLKGFTRIAAVGLLNRMNGDSERLQKPSMHVNPGGLVANRFFRVEPMNILPFPIANPVHDWPLYLNLRESGVVAPPRQVIPQKCQCCGFYQAAYVIESRYFLKTGEKVELSIRQGIDCSETFSGVDGIGSGDMWEYIKANGLYMENDYPYHDKVHPSRVTANH